MMRGLSFFSAQLTKGFVANSLNELYMSADVCNKKLHVLTSGVSNCYW